MTAPEQDVTLTPEALAELRHELRTPINHIVGYAEMLLEDVDQGSYPRHRAALEETLGTARDVLNRISSTLSGTRGVVVPSEIASLYQELRAPQRKILRLVSDLLQSGETAPDGFAQDLQRILSAAERLVPVAPAADQEGEAVVAADAPGGAVASAAPDPGAGHILVTDDDEDNREVLRRRLERDGYRVECAEDGRRALEMIGQRPFDLVLLDMMMPEIDGYAVLEQLKGDPATRDIPVIMISALDDMPSIVRCIERGAEDYLPKPFDPVLLRARISASLEKKRLRDQEVEYLRQVDRVIEAARGVEAGSYHAGGLAAVARRDDALGMLARVFDGMTAQVKAREERLRGQVRALRGEIEEAKRQSAQSGSAVDAGNLTTGERFAERYEVLSVVGRGGMGTVYRVRDLELDEEVAIKTLRREFVADETLLERFKTEIRLARRISHRNVVRTHDFGEYSGVYFLTMEYVEGITVRELIDTRGHLGVPATLAIGTQLAESLAVAHAVGVIHRDIKPQNMLLDAEGVLKVMDFGVARLAERTSALTEAGLVVGTPAYMSPEQLLAETIDARSDLYAMGVVLYECLTGRLPFDAVSAVSLIAKLLSEEPEPPVAHNPEVPPALSALVVRLLAKRPEERVQTAGDLAQQLSQLG